MLTKAALNKLTQAVTNKVLTETRLYNQKLVESVTQEDLRDQFIDKINSDNLWAAQNAWEFLEEHYPPVFTELLSCLREDRKIERLDYPCSYNLHEIVRPEVERLTINLDEFDSDSLLTEQLFEKIYPMLVEAKYIRFESEKNEPVFDLSLPVEEEIIPLDTFEEEWPDSSTEPREVSYEGDWE